METPQHPHPPCPDSHSLPTPEEWPPAPSGTSESTGDFPILSLHRMQRNPFLFSLRGHRRVPPFSPHRTKKGSSILSLKNTGESLCSPLTEHGGDRSILSPQKTQGPPPFLPSEVRGDPPILSPLPSQEDPLILPSEKTGCSLHSPPSQNPPTLLPPLKLSPTSSGTAPPTASPQDPPLRPRPQGPPPRCLPHLHPRTPRGRTGWGRRPPGGLRTGRGRRGR